MADAVRRPCEHLVLEITLTPARFAGSRSFRSLFPDGRGGDIAARDAVGGLSEQSHHFLDDLLRLAESARPDVPAGHRLEVAGHL